MQISQTEQMRGGIYGMLVGDALGVPYEFHPPQEIPAFALIEYTPPAGFARAHAGTPPGTWSDDGALMLALLDSLLSSHGLDLHDFGQRLIAWYDQGQYAVDRRVFDVGIQTSAAIRQLQAGVAPQQAGRSDEQANGNGSLMRVLALALWHTGSDDELVYLAQQQSLLTHAHLRSQVCCALYCLWARRTLEQASDAWQAAVSTLRQLYRDDAAATQELEWSIRPDDPTPGNGSGYVVDCLRSARWAVAQGSYEQVVKAAISLGHDTDTTACVAGGIAGIRDGEHAIPERWRMQLRGRDLVEALCERLVG
ncbi:MAG: ADP-ribosylglycohydrolase family protein [Roseiflexaceae bacterium]